MDHDEDSKMSEEVDESHIENQPIREQLTQRPTFTGWSQSQTDIQTMITANISGLRKQTYACVLIKSKKIRIGYIFLSKSVATCSLYISV